jgi:putative ABC transport system substrate-binding protein
MAGTAAALLLRPRSVRAQPSMTPSVTVLNSGTAAGNARNVEALKDGLKDAGFVDGQNCRMDYFWGDNVPEKLGDAVGAVLQRRPTLIVANTLGAIKLRAADNTIPTVFTSGSDPVRDGLVASLNRPGGIYTGIVFINGALGGKRLALLHQLVPSVATIAMLVSPHTDETEAERLQVIEAARTIGQKLVAYDISNPDDIDAAFTASATAGAGALLVGAGPFLFNSRDRIVALAAQHRVPTLYAEREAVVGGGLMSYDASISDAFRQAGSYAGRLLKGEKPADLPVIQSTKFELVINLKTAKTLGVTVPPNLLALADEVIE